MKKLFFVGLLVCAVLLVAWAYHLCPKPCFSVAGLKAQRLYLQHEVIEHYWAVVFWYIATYTALVALSFPLATLMTLAGGMLFGVFPGSVFAVIGGTIGSVIAFFCVRYFLGNWIQKRYQHRLQFFNKQMHTYGIFYLLGIHFVVIIPFTIVNMLAGLTNVHWWTFTWTTAVGIIPMSILYAFAGQQLTMINQISDIFSLRYFLIIFVLLLSAVLPAMVKALRANPEK